VISLTGTHKVAPMRILLADDHHLVREAIANFLSRTAKDIVCTEAADLLQVKERLAGNAEFDLIILDYNMPGMHGLSGLDEVRKLVPQIPVAIMSGDIDASEAARAIERGAIGIIRKDLRGTALLSALRLMVSGETYIPRSLLKIIEAAPSAETRSRELRAIFGNLTPRELDCVKLLARGNTNREIAAELAISEVTVKLHLNSAFKKMGARNRSDAVRIAIVNGIERL
jgi:two-component system, NarL family, nitrate/nitrite response regulator NarL